MLSDEAIYGHSNATAAKSDVVLLISIRKEAVQ